MMRRAEEWVVSQCSVQGSSVQITAILEQGWAGAEERENATEVEVDHDWTTESPDQGRRCECQAVDGWMKMERKGGQTTVHTSTSTHFFQSSPERSLYCASLFFCAHLTPPAVHGLNRGAWLLAGLAGWLAGC